MWQSIKTAPMDGTRVLAFTSFGPQVLRWSNDYSTSDDYCWNDGEYTYAPSHWMPLPDPPTPDVLSPLSE